MLRDLLPFLGDFGSARVRRPVGCCFVVERDVHVRVALNLVKLPGCLVGDEDERGLRRAVCYIIPRQYRRLYARHGQVLTPSRCHRTRVKVTLCGTRCEHPSLDAVHDSVQPFDLLLRRQVVVFRLRSVRIETLVRHVRKLWCCGCGH